jgi:hypothetical protein
MPETIAAHLVGSFTPGHPLDLTTNDLVMVPSDLYDDDEQLYRVVGRGVGWLNIRPDDILIVQPRPEGNASVAEIVLAEQDGKAYVGRWWTKRGKRVVVNAEYGPVVEGETVRVLGAITLIARPGTWK